VRRAGFPDERPRPRLGDRGEAQRLIKTLGFIGVVQEPSAPTNVGPVAANPSRPALAPLDKPSIAVLPFANLSGDPEHEYFADGMVEEITTALSGIRWLLVIARNSSFAYEASPSTCVRSAASSACAMPRKAVWGRGSTNFPAIFPAQRAVGDVGHRLCHNRAITAEHQGGIP